MVFMESVQQWPEYFFHHPHTNSLAHETIENAICQELSANYSIEYKSAETLDNITQARPQPIMLKILPIMLLSNAQKSNLLCSILCFQYHDYA